MVGLTTVLSVASVLSVAVPEVSADAVSTAGTYVSVSPTRLLDTRAGIGTAGRVAKVSGGGAPLHLQVTGGVVPSGVSAVVLNVTVTGPTSAGFVTAYSDDTTMPTASNVNFLPGQTVPNLVIAPVSAAGVVDLGVSPGASTDLVADVSGYFLGGAPQDAGAFGAVTPTRLLDSRSGVGIAGGVLGKIAPHVETSVQVTGGSIPSGVSAVAVNITITQPGNSGFLTAYADGSAMPSSSNVNFSADQTVPNLVIAPVGSDGKVDVQVASAASAHVIMDVFGYFLGGASTDLGALTSVAPARIADTRSGIGVDAGAVSNKGSISVPVTGVAGVPTSGVSTAILNVTITGPTGAGFVTAHADGTSIPTASNVNFDSGQTVPNLVFAPVGPNGHVTISADQFGSAQIIVDLFGYISGSAPTWRVQSAVDPSAGGLGTISCPTTATCLSADSAGLLKRLDGTSVSTASSGPGSRYAYIQQISCPTVSFCGAIVLTHEGSGRLFTYAGSWVAGPTPSSGSVASVSCPSVTFCLAVDDEGGAMTYNGSSWSNLASSGAIAGSQTVSCASSTYCVSVNSDGTTRIFRGSGWTSAPTAPVTGYSIALTCVSGAFCLASGDGGKYTRLDVASSTWSAAALIDPAADDFDGVSCASATHCVATSVGRAATYDGTTWSTPTAIGVGGYLSVSCVVATLRCVIVDDLGNMAIATTAANTWTFTAGVNPLLGAPTDFSCPSTTFCLGIDWAGGYFTGNGSTWSAPHRIDSSTVGLNAVSCASTTFCVAVGAGGESLTFNGSSWSAPVQAAASGHGLVAISCPSPTFCLAEQDNETSITFNGSTWGNPTTSTWQSSWVSCLSSTFCVAAGIDAAEFYNGTSWTASSIATNMSIDAISCTSTSHCVALLWDWNTNTDSASVFNGTSWSPLTAIADEELTSLSCASATFCVAGGSQVVSLSGSSWGVPYTLGSDSEANYRVRCQSASFCAAADTNDGAMAIFK